ncbi:MAG: histidine phosphatase family protein [Rhodospirillales bacterium]|nr:histidine phosphatase family protein [Rhodospirillales bacterium]
MNGTGISVAFIRHGPTRWNAEKRIQGRIDIPLSPDGQAWVKTWRLPEEFKDRRWYASDKTRAVQTARLIGLDPEIRPGLAEMNWGDWEGLRIEEIREKHGAELTAQEALGLDFRAPNGESRRDVQARIGDWFREVLAVGGPAGAVVHSGVIRGVYSMATGWDMIEKPPVKLLDGSLHLFRIDHNGVPEIDRLNIPLTEN